MNTRAAFRKSVLIQPAVDALCRAETQDELEDAWEDWCAGFAEGSAECRHLREVYQDQLERVGHRAKAVKLLNDLWGAG